MPEAEVLSRCLCMLRAELPESQVSVRRADADQPGMVLVCGKPLPLQEREARPEALCWRHISQASSRPCASMGACTRSGHPHLTSPAGKQLSCSL